MYLIEEVFEMISKRLSLTLEEEQRAWSIQNHILKRIGREYRDKSYFRYNENSKNIALNISNYRIYLYPYKNIKDRYELIYPNSKISELENLGIEIYVTFEFKLFPCKTLSLSFDDIEMFRELEWDSFGEAVAMAYEFGTGRARDNNILIDWEAVENQ